MPDCHSLVSVRKEWKRQFKFGSNTNHELKGLSCVCEMMTACPTLIPFKDSSPIC